MTTTVEWLPFDGPSLTFAPGRQSPLRLLSIDGLGPVPITPQMIESPGQVGQSSVDVVVPPRVVTVQALLQSADQTASWSLRETVSRALRSQPLRVGQRQQLGRLRILRDDQPSRELLAVARSMAMPKPRGGVGIDTLDVEWLAPDPWYRESEDSLLTFAVDGGFTWPIVFPLVVPTNNIEQEVINEGDVDAPIVARLYGDCTTARLLNVTTGETIEIGDEIVAGDYIEISTAFGDKRVELVEADGTRTNAMARLNLSAADFWSLRPGGNLVRFEADTNVSGTALVIWRQRWSGL